MLHATRDTLEGGHCCGFSRGHADRQDWRHCYSSDPIRALLAFVDYIVQGSATTWGMSLWLPWPIHAVNLHANALTREPLSPAYLRLVEERAHQLLRARVPKLLLHPLSDKLHSTSKRRWGGGRTGSGSRWGGRKSVTGYHV